MLKQRRVLRDKNKEIRLEQIRSRLAWSLHWAVVRRLDFILNAVEGHLDIIQQGRKEI